MYCRNCGKQIDDKAVVCVGCGVPPLKGVTYCQSCGKDTAGTTDVCPSCGVKLMSATALGGDDKTWAMVAHLLVIVSGFVGPLIIWLIKGKESAVVEDQAKEALNFGITITIAYVAAGILTVVLIGMLLMPIIGLAQLILPILATVQNNNGNMNYRYPLCLRLIK